MKEQEWLECHNPWLMLEFLRGKVSDRKLRLFAVACCRSIWHLITDERSRCLVEKVEQYADRAVTIFDVSAAWDIHENAYSAYDFKAPWYAAMAVLCDFELTMRETAQAAGCAIWWESIPEDDPIISVVDASGRCAETVTQRQLLYDIIGNPFCQVTFDPVWRTPTVLALAQAAYDARILPSGTLSADRLGVLADALEEARVDGDVVGHLRGPGPHVRGCFAVDLLLGNS